MGKNVGSNLFSGGNTRFSRSLNEGGAVESYLLNILSFSSAVDRRHRLLEHLLTLSKKKCHVNLSRHGEADRVAHLQTRQHFVFVAPPAAHFQSDLQTLKRVNRGSDPHRTRRRSSGSADLLGQSHGVFLQGPGTEGHATLGDGSAEQPFTVGRQHLTDTQRFQTLGY